MKITPYALEVFLCNAMFGSCVLSHFFIQPRQDMQEMKATFHVLAALGIVSRPKSHILVFDAFTEAPNPKPYFSQHGLLKKRAYKKNLFEEAYLNLRVWLATVYGVTV